MNKQETSTALGGATSASFDYRKAYQELEDPIVHALGMARVLVVLADTLSEKCRPRGLVPVPAGQLNNLLFMARRVEQSVENLDGVWSGTWPAEAASEAVVAQALQKEGSTLQALLDAHTGARQAVRGSERLDELSSPPGTPTQESERTRECDAAECRAFDDILKFKPITHAVNARRLEYLFRDSCSPWAEGLPAHGKLDLLLASMVDR